MLIRNFICKSNILVISIVAILISSLISNTTALAVPSTMPNLTGKLSQAQETWSQLGFKTTPKIVQQVPKNLNGYSCRAPLPTDLVIAQDPVFNASVTEDTVVTLTLICHLTTPQNSVVKKPYNPPRGKLKISKKNQSKTSTPSKRTKPQKNSKKLNCKKGKKIITLKSNVNNCPKGYKQQ